MKPCFGYIRVSTQKQGEGVSLEAQKEAITDFASRNDLTVTKWFEEKQTAAKSGRPVFNQMLRQLKQGRAQGLIMHKIDRSARNLRDWALVSELPKHGVKPYFAVDGIDMETRGGRLSANLQAVIAEDYIHNLREECIKGLRGRLKQGLYPFKAPIGYLDNGRGKPKTPCPEKATLIKAAFDLYLSGAHSINSLQQEMALRGLTNHLGKPVSKHGIETILRNPFYTGLIRIERTNETFAGIHEPIVSTCQFERVQEIKAGRAGKKVTRHNHLYRGLFKCDGCGRSMIPERQKGHVYYRCQTKECPKNTIREDRLENAILAAYQRLAMKPEDVERNAKEWLKWLEGGERRVFVKSIELRISKAEERQQNLTDLLIDGVIDRHTFEDRKHRLAVQLASLREELAEQKSSDLSRDKLLKFLELTSSLASLHVSLDHDEKRLMLRNCFSNLCVKANEPVLEPCSWLLSRDFGELSPLVTQLGPLLELLEKHSKCCQVAPAKPRVPRWKYNLKNQRQDDMPDAA